MLWTQSTKQKTKRADVHFTRGAEILYRLDKGFITNHAKNGRGTSRRPCRKIHIFLLLLAEQLTDHGGAQHHYSADHAPQADIFLQNHCGEDNGHNRVDIAE